MSRNIPKIFLFCLNIYKYICFNILFRSGNGIAFLRTRPSQAELGPLPLVPRAASPPKCNTIAGAVYNMARVLNREDSVRGNQPSRWPRKMRAWDGLRPRRDE